MGKEEIIQTILHLYEVEADIYVRRGSCSVLLSNIRKFNEVFELSKKEFNGIKFPDLYCDSSGPNNQVAFIQNYSFLITIKKLIEILCPAHIDSLCDYERMREEYINKKNSLSPEILNIPDELNKINGTDNVIVAFIKESIKAYSSNCILSAAFMLGAASEKAIYLLIECYAESINDETNRNKFKDRISKNKIITAKWDVFKKSYDSCKSKLKNSPLSQDLDTIIGSIFHFCRITRNSIGHPEIVPDLANGTVLANIGNFVEYVGRIYLLMEHFKNNKVDV